MRLNMLAVKYYHIFLVYKVHERVIVTFILNKLFSFVLLEITCKTISLEFA